MHADEPSDAAYMPASQSAQVTTSDLTEYLPAEQKLHKVAPLSEPVFVIEPALQSVHDESVDVFEYLLGAHFVHAVARTAEPVLVIDPAVHSEQYDIARFG